MRTAWLSIIALLTQSCLQSIEEVDVDPMALLQGLFSNPASATTASGFAVGGQIYGDIPTGLQLDFSGTDCGAPQTISPSTTGSYQFSGVPDGCTAADVLISLQPTASYCSIYNNTGRAVSGASISDIDLYCFAAEMPAGPLIVYENAPITIDIRLSASPGLNPVTVSFASSNAGITTTASLIFTSANYGTYQQITINNPTDANLLAESATITSSVAAHNLTDVDVNSFDTTGGSTARFLFVTSGTHNGNFAGDGALTGSNWMQKADWYCSLPANRPASLTGPENYRAVLTDGLLRVSQVGSQLAWPVRDNVAYYGHDGTSFATANTDNVFTFPVSNPIPGGGNYWTGINTVATWNSTDNCNSWASGSIAFNGSYGIGTFTNSSLINQGSQSCDQLKSLLCAQDLRDRGDGTISSAHQNLLWQKCESGQTWSGSCTGAVSFYAYCSSANDTCNGGSTPGSLDGFGASPAYNYCNSLGLAGRSWRVPTRAELQELFRATRQDSSLLPGLVTVQYYLSTESHSIDRAYAILFSGGTEGNLMKNSTFRIRCVSDGM
ncbi:MAG: DUF1554 domain-containing protein [Leptonema illini]|uniref:DUF1554 domain-containing protein n=1 Tax=Leptonema illini TaxID=183 RepID=A0A833LY31_9LEPT|nr:MAG: DUF1554 domain-containing protein [Leptonema illini]